MWEYQNFSFQSFVRRFKIVVNFNNQKANNTPDKVDRMHMTAYGSHTGVAKR